MIKVGKIVIVTALAAAIIVVIVVKDTSPPSPSTQPAANLPRLVDLGSTSCIPCKMMAPILEELKTEYAGRMQVEFIDVGADPDAGKSYAIKLIPTQVFYDASGKEIWRHEGFFSKEDILAKWKELGVVLAAPAGGANPATTTQPAVKSGST